MPYRRKLIEVALPLEAINKEAAREKSIRHGHPSTLHLWWARRPLAACRAVLFSSLVDDPDEPQAPTEYLAQLDALPYPGDRREKLFAFIEDLVKWDNSNNERIIGIARSLIKASAGTRPPAPPDTDDLATMLGFAYDYDAYSRGYDMKALFEFGRPIVARYKKTGEWVGSLDDLRTCLFYLQRQHHNDEQPVFVAPAQPGTNADLPTWHEPTELRQVMWSLYHTIRQRWNEIEPELPPVLDPFCGGGSIPLEAQRLGLEAHGSDLNPVAVLITKALIEIPPKFAGMPPVNPEAQKTKEMKTWKGAQGLAEDVRYYGHWMRGEAEKRIGHLYPKGPNGETILAWVWARTVKCPNPACGTEMPLIRSFALDTRQGHKVSVRAHPDRQKKVVDFEVVHGETAADGTVSRQGAVCLACGSPVPFEHVRAYARQFGFGRRPIAVVCEGPAGRSFTQPTPELLQGSDPPPPADPASGDIVDYPGHTNVFRYGLTQWHMLFTSRQLSALTAFSDLLAETRSTVCAHAVAAGMESDGLSLEQDGAGAEAYADAITVYLAFAIDKAADYWSTVATWATGGFIRGTFARQALPMTWDFAECNPLSDSTGNWSGAVDWVVRVIARLPATGRSVVTQRDATQLRGYTGGVMVSTDPPYYDNIGYADLSDFFYVWLRRGLAGIMPALFGTVLVPKAEELVATTHRFGGDRDAARRFFEDGLSRTFGRVRGMHIDSLPTTVYYAFKQTEADEGDEGEAETSVASTGWETMLEGLLSAGFSITGTWPMRTERGARTLGVGRNTLASSIILVCRPRPDDAPMATRREFLNAMKNELPHALRQLQKGNIAPVDLAQAAIGPGMAVFSRYSKVMETDGTAMSVRTALALINQMLDEVLAEQEGEFDADTRWALAWFEQHGFTEGVFGDAETLSKAKNTSVQGMVDAGILTARAGKVQLLKREALPVDWDPAGDARFTIWEATQYLIRALEQQGEMGAAALLRRLGANGEVARDLAYRLYSICERKRWAQDAIGYNSLVISWPEIQRLTAEMPEIQGGGQATLDV